MKRYIRSTVEDFVPEPFTSQTAHELLYSIQEDIERKLSPRYLHVEVDFNEISFNSNSVYATFNVYAEGRPAKSYKFAFESWEDYFDQIDYEAHLNQTISNFLEGIR